MNNRFAIGLSAAELVPSNPANVLPANSLYTYNPTNFNRNYLVQDYYNPLDPHQLYYQEMKQEALFLFASCAALLVLILIVLFAFCCHCLSYRTKHVLVTLILVLEFAIAVVLLLRYANN